MTEQVATVPMIDTLHLRIQRIMKSDVVWRAMGLDGSDGAFITIHKNELELWEAAGVHKDIFEKEEHVFPVNEQPTVQVKKNGSYYTFIRISINGKYMNTVEWKNSLVTTPSPAIAPVPAKPQAPTEVTIEYLDAQIDKLYESRASQRLAARTEQKLVFTTEDLAREKAEVYMDVLMHTDAMLENYGKLQLRLLWRSRSSGDFRNLPNQPQTIALSLRNQQLRQRDYTMSLAHVVDKIFGEVDALEKAGTPFLHPVTSVPITVAYLILTPGLILKLTKSADYWSKLVDLDSKRTYMGLLVTKTAEELKAIREAGSKVTNVETRVKVSFENIKGDEKHKRMILVVDEAQEIAILRAIKSLVEDIKQ